MQQSIKYFLPKFIVIKILCECREEDVVSVLLANKDYLALKKLYVRTKLASFDKTLSERDLNEQLYSRGLFLCIQDLSDKYVAHAWKSDSFTLIRKIYNQTLLSNYEQAFKTNNEKIISFIITHSAEKLESSYINLSKALIYACKSNNKEAVQWLISNEKIISIYGIVYSSHKAFLYCCRAGKPEFVKIFYYKVYQNKHDCRWVLFKGLNLAYRHCQADVVKFLSGYLIPGDKEVSAAYASENSLMILLASERVKDAPFSSIIYGACERGDMNFFNSLDVPDVYGYSTALIYACRSTNLDLIAILMQQVQDHTYAFIESLEYKNYEVSIFLLKQKATINWDNIACVCSKNIKLNKLVLKHINSFDLLKKIVEKNCFETMKLSLSYSMSDDLIDALTFAVELGRTKICEMLLNAGIKPNKDLHVVACQYGWSDLALLFKGDSQKGFLKACEKGHVNVLRKLKVDEETKLKGMKKAYENHCTRVLKFFLQKEPESFAYELLNLDQKPYILG